MKLIKLKKIAEKASLFFVTVLTLGLITGKSFAQTTYPDQRRPDSTAHMNPNSPGQDMSTPQQKQKPDTTMHWKAHKLSQTEIDKIVGSDTKLGLDAKGRQLYKETASGKQYYINDSGTKVYVK